MNNAQQNSLALMYTSAVGPPNVPHAVDTKKKKFSPRKNVHEEAEGKNENAGKL